ncbi:MAG: Histone acetyltransferase [Solirubrobacterales bacterium]|nr:Histone acetyltransferase [Solirubrobacterales bacterium]
MIEIRPVRSDQPPADALVAAMVTELEGLYGPMAQRRTPSAHPDELWLPNGTYLVVSEDGTPVAGGGIKGLAPGMGEIKRMYVVPDVRGRGWARRLLLALEDAARELGHTRVRLDTGPKQAHAQRLYESAGYRSIPSYNDNDAAAFWGEKRLDVSPLFLRADPAKAERLLLVQRAAYAAEAELMGFEGIPPLHETLEELLGAEHQEWLGRFDGPTLVGALAWEDDGDAGAIINRLVVAPTAWRRGHARALMEAFDARVAGRPVTVSTGSANAPALAFYARSGFRVLGEEEIAPGVGMTRLLRAP